MHYVFYAYAQEATVDLFMLLRIASLLHWCSGPIFTLCHLLQHIWSDNEDMGMHNAFALWFSAGMEIQWKRLIFGMGWKGCTAKYKYKDMMDNLMSEFEEEYKSNKSSESYKFDTNMFIVSIGLAF